MQEADPVPPTKSNWGGQILRRPRRLSLGFVLVTLLVWAAVTLLGGVPVADGDPRIGRVLSQTIAWNIAGGAVVVLLVGWFAGQLSGWFSKPHGGAIRAFWLPICYLLLLFGAAFGVGQPPVGALVLLLANCLLIGVSEEVMFRGLLYRGLRGRLGIRGAVWLSSAVFGAVHVLNSLMTGNLPEAIVQSLFAMMLGLVLMAMALRSGSLIWPILYHALWDFGALVIGHGIEPPDPGASPDLSLVMFLPVVLILPNALYALWLIRCLPHHPNAMDRA
jgi:membrane protease YdiL (CAAX protease family)